MKPTMQSLCRRVYWYADEHQTWDMLGLIEGICELIGNMVQDGCLSDAEWRTLKDEIEAQILASKESGDILSTEKYLAQHNDWTDRLPFLWLLSISDTA